MDIAKKTGHVFGLPPDAVEMLKNASTVDSENKYSKCRIAEIDRASSLIMKRYPEHYWPVDKNGKTIRG